MYKRKANNIDNYDMCSLDEFSTKKRKTEHGWVSGTTIANYLNGEPLLDWLNLYYNKYGFKWFLVGLCRFSLVVRPNCLSYDSIWF